MAGKNCCPGLGTPQVDKSAMLLTPRCDRSDVDLVVWWKRMRSEVAMRTPSRT